MKTKEMIPVFIKCRKGETVCICHRFNKMCDENCEKDIVDRDLFRGWEDTMRRDRYGRSPGEYND